jgi:hypothetical protein
MKYREKHTNAKREWGESKRKRKGEKSKRRRRMKQTETARNRGVAVNYQRSIVDGLPAHTKARALHIFRVCVI